MNINKYFLIASILLVFTRPSIAHDLEYSEEFSGCMDKSDGITVNMLNCIAEEYKRQDDRLNKAYKEVMNQLSTERKEDLRKAQILWIKYRDANCDFYVDLEGGSFAGVSGNDCLLRETTERANELESFNEP